MISIVIPAFNEGRRIASSLEKLSQFLRNRTEEFEVIVVDDASTDDTSQVAESFKDRIQNLTVMKLEVSPFAGKGYAVNKGILASKGDVALFTDADFSTPIEEIDKLLAALNQGHDIAIGSRALNRSLVQKRQNPLRDLMGRVFNIIVQMLAIRGIVDSQCGFKAFKMPQSRKLFEDEKVFDFGFDVELLYLAKKNGLKIVEVPVIWINDPRSTVNPIKDSIKMFIDLFKIRLYHSPKNGSLLDRIFYLTYNYRTFLRFSIVGVSNTIVDYGLFYTLTRLVGLDRFVANPISVEIAIIWSFTWNNLWTFSERQVDKPVFIRFLIFQFVSLGGLVLSQITLLLFNQYLGIYDLLAKAMTIPIVLIFNYFFNSRWTFKDERAGKTAWYGYSIFILILVVVYFVLTKIQ